MKKPAPATHVLCYTRSVLKRVCTLNFVLFVSLVGVSLQASALNRIQTENALAGSAAWSGFRLLGSQATDNPHDLEGYADKDSVNIGGTIKFFVNANKNRYPRYSLTVYRMGWYGGLGARKMTNAVSLPSVIQAMPTSDPVTGLVDAKWLSSYTLKIPTTWTSGVYIATLVGSTVNEGQYIPFVVRDVNRNSPYLFQFSTTTWQAYNAWGGKSVYGYNSNATPVKGNTGNFQPARKVSFNRPYDVGGGVGALFSWEINALSFMEKEGYDVTYQSDIDTHTGDGGLLNHQAFLSVGHDEYWTKGIRDNVENAQLHGVSLGFLGANIGYWQIRLENNNRTIVAYKDFSQTEDPFALDADTTNDKLVTTRWREGIPGDGRLGAGRPENALIGVMYAFGPKGNGDVTGSIISTKSDPWLGQPAFQWVYTNTGVVPNTAFPGLLGYEADRVFDELVYPSPANLTIVGASPVPVGTIDHDSPASVNYDPSNPKSHMTVYSKSCVFAPCQNGLSTVFAAGSLNWVVGLDTRFKWPLIDPIVPVQQMARNIFQEMVNPWSLSYVNSASLKVVAPTRLASIIDHVLETIVPSASAATKVQPALPTQLPANNLKRAKFPPNLLKLIKYQQKVEKAKIKRYRDAMRKSGARLND